MVFYFVIGLTFWFLIFKLFKNFNDFEETNNNNESQLQLDLPSYNRDNIKLPYSNYSVYFIKNSFNRRVYVGMTNNFERRKSEHFNPEYRAKENKILYKFMSEMGQDNFQMIELFSGLSKQYACYAEARLIKNWSTIYPYGYNVNEELDNRQLGLNISKYNRDFFEKVKAIANFEYKNEILK